MAPELSTNKAAMLRAFKACDTSRNGLLGVSEFRNLFALLKNFNKFGNFDRTYLLTILL